MNSESIAAKNGPGGDVEEQPQGETGNKEREKGTHHPHPPPPISTSSTTAGGATAKNLLSARTRARGEKSSSKRAPAESNRDDTTADQSKREELCRDVFLFLDKAERGFLLRAELRTILQAAIEFDLDTAVENYRNKKVAAATSSTSGSGVGGGRPGTSNAASVVFSNANAGSSGSSGSIKSWDLSRIYPDVFLELTRDVSLAKLEDVRWFAESVHRVEQELLQAWQQECANFQRVLEQLYSRNLHCYLLRFLPPKVARWLKFRIKERESTSGNAYYHSAGGATTIGPASAGGGSSSPSRGHHVRGAASRGAATGIATTGKTTSAPSALGVSKQEVETLLVNETAEDIKKLVEQMETPFAKVLESFDSLKKELSDQTIVPIYKALEDRVLQQLEFLENEVTSRLVPETALMLLQEGALPFLACLIRCRAFTQQSAVLQACLKLVLALLDLRIDLKTHVAEVLFAEHNNPKVLAQVMGAVVLAGAPARNEGERTMGDDVVDSDLQLLRALLSSMNAVFLKHVKPALTKFLEVDYLHEQMLVADPLSQASSPFESRHVALPAACWANPGCSSASSSSTSSGGRRYFFRTRRASTFLDQTTDSASFGAFSRAHGAAVSDEDGEDDHPTGAPKQFRGSNKSDAEEADNHGACEEYFSEGGEGPDQQFRGRPVTATGLHARSKAAASGSCSPSLVGKSKTTLGASQHGGLSNSMQKEWRHLMEQSSRKSLPCTPVHKAGAGKNRSGGQQASAVAAQNHASKMSTRAGLEKGRTTPRLLDKSPTDGFYRAKTGAGAAGQMPKGFVKGTAPSASSASQMQHKRGPDLEKKKPWFFLFDEDSRGGKSSLRTSTTASKRANASTTSSQPHAEINQGIKARIPANSEPVPDNLFPSFSLGREKARLVKQFGANRFVLPALPKQILHLFEDSITISDLIADLFSNPDSSDFDRGEVLDSLIKFDERRLLMEHPDQVHQLPAGDNIAGTPDGAAAGASSVERSVFSYGRFVLLLLFKLDVASNFRQHEQRTPLRTHMLKLLLQVLRGNNACGRVLFHLGEGTRVLCTLIKGNTFGKQGAAEIDEEEEDDREEEDFLYHVNSQYENYTATAAAGGGGAQHAGTSANQHPPSASTNNSSTPQLSPQLGAQVSHDTWPYTQTFEHAQYYALDFLDDKFYGSRDRQLATAFLETLGELWGTEALVQELFAYPYSLQIFTRARDAGNLCYLISEMLTSPLFDEYLFNVAKHLARAYSQDLLVPLITPDGATCSLWPVRYDDENFATAPPGRDFLYSEPEAAVGSQAERDRRGGIKWTAAQANENNMSVFRSFQGKFVHMQAQNIQLRVLAAAFHHLQIFLQEENEKRNSGTNNPAAAGGASNGMLLTTQQDSFLSDLTCCCELLAEKVYQLLVFEEDKRPLASVLVNVFEEIRHFSRRALLAVSPLAPVNVDERQKARTLEFAKFVQPRPMYFGHYQQLIYNNSSLLGGNLPIGNREIVTEYGRKLKCLQGSGNIITGENRYLSEPALYPTEFLIVLRILQLLRLHVEAAAASGGTSQPGGAAAVNGGPGGGGPLGADGALGGSCLQILDRNFRQNSFVKDLVESLEQLTGLKPSHVFFAQQQEDLQVLEDDELVALPWRTGIVPLNTFRLSQVPLRRSNLRGYPRHSLLHLVGSLIALLKQYEALPLWDQGSYQNRNASAGFVVPSAETKQSLELALNRRSVLLGVLFSHLCYYHPKAVTFEDTNTGLANRLGVSLPQLESFRDFLLLEISPANQAGEGRGCHEVEVDISTTGVIGDGSFAQHPARAREMNPATERVWSVLDEFSWNSPTTADAESSPGWPATTTRSPGAVVFGLPGVVKLGFVRLGGFWFLWANAVNNYRTCLTDVENLQNYFSALF
ncbi:unnamed protein product [Amoebophrya sp. A120]|nr:unnamed protein product [Amoebophrya sp. A120]|eukprot:GSA120T00016586001.1